MIKQYYFSFEAFYEIFFSLFYVRERFENRY